MTQQQRTRKVSALGRLQAQIKRGTKTVKGGTAQVPLEGKDIKRINKEINILDTKLQ
jgi:hypothetical protein